MYKFTALISDEALIYSIDFKIVKVNYKVNRKKKVKLFYI